MNSGDLDGLDGISPTDYNNPPKRSCFQDAMEDMDSIHLHSFLHMQSNHPGIPAG